MGPTKSEIKTDFDVEQRGRTEQVVRLQYEETVRPASVQFVRRSAKNADLTIDGVEALDWKVEQVRTAMRARGLLRSAS